MERTVDVWGKPHVVLKDEEPVAFFGGCAGDCAAVREEAAGAAGPGAVAWSATEPGRRAKAC